MKLESIKDLESVIKLCRKTGVLAITIDGVAIQLGDLPQRKLKSEGKDEAVSQPQYTEDDMALWSVGGA